MLSRAFRLRKNRDIRRVQQKGHKVFTRHLRLQYLNGNREHHVRCTVLMSVKVAKHATVRNRLKRQVRACLGRFVQSNPHRDLDMLVTITNYSPSLSVDAECVELLGKITQQRSDNPTTPRLRGASR